LKRVCRKTRNWNGYDLAEDGGNNGEASDMTLEAEDQEENPDRAARRADAEAKEGKSERTIAIWTIVVAAFTGCLFFASLGSDYYLARTDDAVQKTLLLGQRAFVQLDKIDITSVDSWSYGRVATDQNTKTFEVPENEGKMLHSIFTITNAGNTPVVSPNIRIACGFADGVADPFEILKRDATAARQVSIGARQTIDVSVSSCDFRDMGEIYNAKIRAVPTYLVGDIQYRDAVDPKVVHHTQFARRFVIIDFGQDDRFTSMHVTTEPDGPHNCCDADCPK
jgi:hypothetical protein